MELPAMEARALRDSHLRFDVQEVRPGEYRITTTRWVGVDTILGVEVFVHPKMKVDRLLYLMARGAKLPLFSGHAHLQEEPDIVAALRVAFVTVLDEALSNGLLQTYEERYDDLRAMRGSIDVHRQFIQRFGVLPPVSCVYDEYTPDNAPNRLLLAAARKLLMAPTRDSYTRSLRRHVRDLSESATSERPPESASLPVGAHLALGRTADAYRTALSLAEAVLAGTFVRFSSGDRRTIGFAVNMDNVYERFLRTALRECLGAPPWLWNRPSLRLLAGDQERHEPDMVWWHRPGRARLVLDAKWMDVDRRRNARKMLIYCQALGLDDGVLIYGGGEERVHKVPLGKTRVHAWCLPVDGTIEELEQRLAAFAERLRSLAPAKPFSSF